MSSSAGIDHDLVHRLRVTGSSEATSLIGLALIEALI
jgi:hypothetical protein